MNTSQKSYVEIYQSLHPVAKQLVEIFAYACCPLDYFDLYVAVRETDRSINSTKYNRALNSLCQSVTVHETRFHASIHARSRIFPARPRRARERQS